MVSSLKTWKNLLLEEIHLALYKIERSLYIIIIRKEDLENEDNQDHPLEYSLEGSPILERNKCLADSLYSTLCGIHRLQG